MSATSSTPASSYSLVLRDAFPWANGQGAYDIVLDFVDDNGNPYDASSLVLSPDVQSEVARIVVAAYSAYAHNQIQGGRPTTDTNKILTNTSIVRRSGTPDDWNIDDRSRPPPVDGNGVQLEAARVQDLRTRYGFSGQTVKDAMNLADALLKNRVTDWSSAGRSSTRYPGGIIPSAPTLTDLTSPPSLVSPPGGLPLFHSSETVTVPTDFTSLPTATPDSTHRTLREEELETPEQRAARDNYYRFMQTPFRLSDINRDLNFADIYAPRADERDRIGAHFLQAMQRIRDGQPLSADQRTLWSMMQQYFYHRLKGIQFPWSRELWLKSFNFSQIFEQDVRSFNIFQGMPILCCQTHLGLSEFRDLLTTYQITQDDFYNMRHFMPNSISPVMRSLWGYAPPARTTPVDLTIATPLDRSLLSPPAATTAALGTTLLPPPATTTTALHGATPVLTSPPPSTTVVTNPNPILSGAHLMPPPVRTLPIIPAPTTQTSTPRRRREIPAATTSTMSPTEALARLRAFRMDDTPPPSTTPSIPDRVRGAWRRVAPWAMIPIGYGISRLVGAGVGLVVDPTSWLHTGLSSGLTLLASREIGRRVI